jgi:hypothetical protein
MGVPHVWLLKRYKADFNDYSTAVGRVKVIVLVCGGAGKASVAVRLKSSKLNKN